jgi:hypothetical protein
VMLVFVAKSPSSRDKSMLPNTNRIARLCFSEELGKIFTSVSNSRGNYSCRII